MSLLQDVEMWNMWNVSQDTSLRLISEASSPIHAQRTLGSNHDGLPPVPNVPRAYPESCFCVWWVCLCAMCSSLSLADSCSSPSNQQKCHLLCESFSVSQSTAVTGSPSCFPYTQLTSHLWHLWHFIFTAFPSGLCYIWVFHPCLQVVGWMEVNHGGWTCIAVRSNTA